MFQFECGGNTMGKGAAGNLGDPYASTTFSFAK